jgi:hypothetical protein
MYKEKTMLRLFWAIVVVSSLWIMTLMVGCTGRGRKKVEVYNVDTLNTNYSIYIIDNCEYIVYYNGNSTWGSHKGNCNNPIHNH